MTQGSLKLNYFVITNNGPTQISTPNLPETVVAPVLLYPNPVDNTLYIRSEFLISGIMLSDVNGKTLLEQQQTNSVDMSKYPAGIYFLTIKSSDREPVFRKIVKR
jgi:hypothetical protein